MSRSRPSKVVPLIFLLKKWIFSAKIKIGMKKNLQKCAIKNRQFYYKQTRIKVL